MNKQDTAGVRTAQDLERKYDFASLLGLGKSIETIDKKIVKVENELNNTLNTLIINLKDVLDSQSEISLWFYSGIPTLLNEPYINWNDPSDHIGDIYYDRDTGMVYQFNEQWLNIDDINLINAMALTNIETDIEQDNERKVFFNIPQVPYSNGDWWIKEDGTLFICQLSKSTGEYEENDFIIYSKYVDTISSKIGNNLIVTNGRILTVEYNVDEMSSIISDVSYSVNEQGETIGALKNRTNSLEQTATQTSSKITSIENSFNSYYTEYAQDKASFRFNIDEINGILENGVETLKNKLVTIDNSGVNVSSNNSEITSTLDNIGLSVNEGQDELLFAGYDSNKERTEVRAPNFLSENMTAGNHRQSKYKTNRTGWFYVGGE